MTRSALCLVFLASALALPARAALILDYYGFDWETSASDPVIPWQDGNTLHVVGLIDALEPPLIADLVSNEYTLSVSAVEDGPAALTGSGFDMRGAYDIYQVTYSGPVTFEVYEDASRDAVFDENPPNAAVPGSFVNGELYLSATASSLSLVINDYTASGLETGVLDVDLTVTGGSHAGDLGGPGAIVHTSHLLKNEQASIPAGYTHRLDGQYLLDLEPVAPSTWGSIKALYH